MDGDEISYECLTDEQLLYKTTQFLRILEQRLDKKQILHSQQVQNLMSESEKHKSIHTIFDQLQGLVSSGNAQGFVFGLITENKTWSTSSDNLLRWWNKDVNFDQNGPRVLASDVSESFGLGALKDLHNKTLSSLISVLMPYCKPSQRSAPFTGETPVAWWPKGTEEWWGRVKFLKDSDPPKYKKPHDLKKNAKIAVLIGIIKNLEPNFSRICRLVSDSQFLQSKMNQRERSIWHAVIRGEETRMLLHPDYRGSSNANISGNSRNDNENDEKVDCRNTDDKLIDIVNSASFEEGESSSENKEIIASKHVVNIGSSASTGSQGLVFDLTMVDEPEAENDNKKLNGESVANPEKVPVSKNNFPTLSQSSFLAKNMASKSKSIKNQKLIGVVNPDPKRLKLPYITYACRWRSHDIQGALSGSAGSFDEIIRSKESREIMNIGIEAKNIPNNQCGNNAWKLSRGHYAGTMSDSNQEFQVQTNNSNTNPSSASANRYNLNKNKTGQSYDSSTSFSAPIGGHMNPFSSYTLIPHDQSMNQYTIDEGPVSTDNQLQNLFKTNYSSLGTTLSITGDPLNVGSSFQPHMPVSEGYKLENYETNKMERSAFIESGAVSKYPNSTLMQGSMGNKKLDFQFQTSNRTLNPSPTSINNFGLNKHITDQPIASYSMPTRGQNTTLNLADIVKSSNRSNTANQSSRNVNPQIQHQLPLYSNEPGSVNINPQCQDQVILVSEEQGSRYPKPQFGNQFESGSSYYPILESGNCQITNSKQGINGDAEKTMEVYDAMDSDTAAASPLLDFGCDDLPVQLSAFYAPDSNNLDGIF